MNKIYTELQNEMKNILNVDEEVDISVPKSKEFGHLTSNIALKFSKKLNRTPREVYQIIKGQISYTSLNIKRIDFIEPGFINFILTDKWFEIYGRELIENSILIHKISIENCLFKYIDKAKNNMYNRAYLITEQMNNIIEIINKKQNGNKDVKIINVSRKQNKDKTNIVVKPFQQDEECFVNLSVENMFFYSCSKNRSTLVNISLDKAFTNSLNNPYNYVTYPYLRANNIIKLLKNEGYNYNNINAEYLFDDNKARELFLKYLTIGDVITEAVKYYEPYKLLAFLKELSDIFYEYNNKLLIRKMNKNRIEVNLFILKIYTEVVEKIMNLLKI
ncbi:DALR anticodon-binding domain-containing protein [Abyssisolibacter fermentans]|uniref:DALR anticodon-binding domain-containing protein n=1 Tax=Abyssisolibacter fermentans TaxID=1766203 RepID=UPI000831F26E|nr:DALR anticodon-binding domain-containing protein [Abyssisolibacter fermentans]